MAPRAVHRPVVRLLGAFVAVSAAGGVLAAGLAIPGVAASGAATRSGVNVFNELPSDLGDNSLSEATTIEYSDGSVMARVYDQNRSVVAFDQIAPVMKQAIVAIEDSRFYEHGPVDVRGIGRALVNNASGGDGTQGASTLTQQYVKNVLVEQAVEQGDTEAAQQAVTATGIDGYARKLREMKLAVGVEKSMSKDEILAGYLNIAYFYNNVYGIEAASQLYFNKSAKDLTLPEAAMLAGLVQNPAAFNPLKKPDAAVTRRNVVLDRMHELGIIDQPTLATALAAPIGLNPQLSRQGCLSAGSAAYFCDYVTRVVETDETFGKTLEDRQKLLKRGGLTIRTTLDRNVQQITQDAVDAAVRPGQYTRMAAPVVEAGTGRILAMAQDTTFSLDADQPGVTTINYNVDKQYHGGSGFQTGSSFKAFTLAEWLKQGKSLSSTVAAPTKGVDNFSAFTACGKKARGSVPYTYYNSEPSEGGAPVTVSEATAKSINTAYVSMEKALDLCDIAATAESMGVHIADPATEAKGKLTDASDVNDANNGVNPSLQVSPSLTLGVNTIAPLTMAAAYATFAADGTFCKPIAITEVLDSDGKPLTVPGADCKQVLDVNVARNVTTALKGVISSGTGTGARIDRPAAGKTGTAQASRDAWFVGYSTQLASAVWMGHETGSTSLNSDRINGRGRRTIYGGTIAAPTWKAIVGQASDALNLPRTDFTPGNLSGLTTTSADGRVRVPSVVGRSVSSARSALEAAGFSVQIASGRVASKSVAAGLVASQSARSATAGATITLTRSSGAPAVAPQPTTAPPSSDTPPAAAPTQDAPPPAGGGPAGGSPAGDAPPEGTPAQ